MIVSNGWPNAFMRVPFTRIAVITWIRGCPGPASRTAEGGAPFLLRILSPDTDQESELQGGRLKRPFSLLWKLPYQHGGQTDQYGDE